MYKNSLNNSKIKNINFKYQLNIMLTQQQLFKAKYKKLENSTKKIKLKNKFDKNNKKKKKNKISILKKFLKNQKYCIE
jgi:hypothetical protein